MLRSSKILLVFIAIIFVLACNFVTQPIKDVQDLAGTAQSIATSIPIETLQALPSVIPSVIPQSTLEALPSLAPTFDAVATQIGSAMNPQGTPVQEWNGIPVMPQATAGQEFTENNTNIYSFRANVTAKDVQDFYKEKLTPLGWNQPFSIPGGEDAGVIAFQKDNNILTIVITPSDGSVVVLLTLA